MAQGTMTQQWTVWCNDCQQWDTVSGSKGECSKNFKEAGWKKIKGVWYCPDCAKNPQKSC